jgi:spore coat polysaccharide biosynthesis protein SpsF
MVKVVATIEARMGSTRLPGKVLREVVGVPLLGHLISRLQACDKLDGIVVASTTNPVDDVISEYCQSLGVAIFRGDEDDVMGRVLTAAASFAADIVVETTGDNPLLDPAIVDLHVETFLSNTADYVSNVVVPTFPDGMDVQVFSLETLRRSEASANHPLDREHVTRHIRQHPEIFTQIDVVAPLAVRRPDLSVTVDVDADFEIVRLVLENLYKPSEPFTCTDLVAFLDAHPEIAELNSKVRRKGLNS